MEILRDLPRPSSEIQTPGTIPSLTQVPLFCYTPPAHSRSSTSIAATCFMLWAFTPAAVPSWDSFRAVSATTSTLLKDPNQMLPPSEVLPDPAGKSPIPLLPHGSSTWSHCSYQRVGKINIYGFVSSSLRLETSLYPHIELGGWLPWLIPLLTRKRKHREIK